MRLQQLLWSTCSFTEPHFHPPDAVVLLTLTKDTAGKTKQNTASCRPSVPIFVGPNHCGSAPSRVSFLGGYFVQSHSPTCSEVSALGNTLPSLS